MSTSVPARPDFPSSLSRSEERIRRLELRIGGAVAQADPAEADLGAPAEPDPVVQWLQRGGSNTAGTSPLARVDPAPTACGPLARFLWRQESTGQGASEALIRQTRELRQRLGLLPHPRKIGQLFPDGVVARHMLSGGPNLLTVAGTGAWYYQTTTGKVTTLALPSFGQPGDVWTYSEHVSSPGCGSCFGGPSCPGGLGCGDSEVTWDFTTMFAPYSDGAWVWGTVAGGNIWVIAGPSRGLVCVDWTGGHFGFTVTHGCFGGPCDPCVGSTDPTCKTPCICSQGEFVSNTVYTCEQATCNFGYAYAPALGLACGQCGGGDRKYLNGGEQVRQLDGFHTMAQGVGAVFCSGVASNQEVSPPAAIFVVPESVMTGWCWEVDATPVDRSIVASWSPGYGTGAPNRAAWDFNEWTYDGDAGLGGPEGATTQNIFRGDGAMDPGSGDAGTPVDWTTFRDRVYIEIATGRYPAVCDWVAAQTAAFVPFSNPGWHEVALCGNWEGYLACRRVGGVVEWTGTIRNYQPIVGPQVTLATYVPAEAMPPSAPFSGFYAYAVASTPAGPLLIQFTQENALDAGVTGAISVARARLQPTYQTGNTTTGPAFIHPVVQTNPGGPYEEITFDGVSYHGWDLPIADAGVPWLTTLEPLALDCGPTTYDLPAAAPGPSALDQTAYDLETGDTILWADSGPTPGPSTPCVPGATVP